MVHSTVGDRPGGEPSPAAWETLWQPVLARAEELAASGERVILAIDGRCGSGKSALAELLAQRFGCCVFHMDDFYLPPAQRTAQWETIPCANMDLERFRQEVLLPASRGECVRYRPYRCAAGRLGAVQTVQPPALNVVEGSYAMHPLLRPYYDAAVFLTCTPQAQLRRLRAREGAHCDVFVNRWIPLEEAYLRAYQVEQSCEITMDTSDFF